MLTFRPVPNPSFLAQSTRLTKSSTLITSAATTANIRFMETHMNTILMCTVSAITSPSLRLDVQPVRIPYRGKRFMRWIRRIIRNVLCVRNVERAFPIRASMFLKESRSVEDIIISGMAACAEVVISPSRVGIGFFNFSSAVFCQNPRNRLQISSRPMRRGSRTEQTFSP